MVESPDSKRVEELSYDEVLYDSNPFPHTHPRHLYTVAKLFNLNPPDFRKCRVLELGCSSGGNLFPQAQQYPESEFVGIDISGQQIEKAQEALKELKFKNIKFLKEDITKITKDLGEFDYIISHGVLSWVPPEVQNKLFEVYKNHLSPNGIGFISYNTLPGWNMVRSVRDAMKFHANRFDSASDKIIQSKSLLDFLSKNLNDKDPYKQIIDSEKNMLADANDYYVFHDHLETENHQFYLHEFTGMAKQYDLQYVGDTTISSMYIGNMPEATIKDLSSIGNDIVMQEQYMDFLKNRRFRNSVLTRSNKNIDRNISPNNIFDFLVTANFSKDIEKSTSETGVFYHKKILDRTMGFNDPDLIEVFISLCDKELRPVYLKDLIEDVCQDKKSQERVCGIIERSGIEMVMRDFLSLHSNQGDFIETVNKKPIANPLARYQASQKGCYMITNCLGDRVKIDKIASLILKNLDGQNDVKSLVIKLLEYAQKGELSLDIDDLKSKDSKEISTVMKKSVSNILQNFSKRAVLVG